MVGSGTRTGNRSAAIRSAVPRCGVAAACLGAALLWGGSAAAIPAGAAPRDDWGLERHDDDASVVGARLERLRHDPLDRGTFQALRRSLGSTRLRSALAAALQRRPGDRAFVIVSARLAVAERRFEEATALLDGLGSHPWRSSRAYLELVVEAYTGAHRTSDAVRSLRDAARGGRPGEAAPLLQRALELEQRAGHHAGALELAKDLVAARPGSAADLRVLADTATNAGDRAVADEAFSRLVSVTPAPRRATARLAWAEARTRLGDLDGAIFLLDRLLGELTGSSLRDAALEAWLTAHRRRGTAHEAAAALGARLEGGGSAAGTAAQWRALGAAREASGQDPTSAWRRAVALDARDEATRAALARALLSRGHVAEVLALERERPLLAADALDLAGRLVSGGHRAEGLTLAARVEARARRDPEILAALLDFHNLHDEPALALAVAERLAAVRGRDPDAKIALGEQLWQMGHVPAALEAWSELPRLERPRHAGLARWAEVLAAHGRTAEATAALTRALEDAPEEPRYHAMLAAQREEQGRPSLAIGHWRAALRLAKEPRQRTLRDEARTRIIEILVATSGEGRGLQAAIADARRALGEQASTSAALEAGRFLAELHGRLEQWGSAVDAWRACIELDTADPELQLGLAAALRRAGRPRDALPVYEALATRMPHRSAGLLTDAAEAAFDAGDGEGALRLAERAAAADATGISALLRIGELWERRGEPDQATRAYRRADELAPRDGRARLRLAELDLSRGDVGRAGATFRELTGGGASADLARDAGRRALDLVQLGGDGSTMLDLAVARMRAAPDLDESRELLLDALERAGESTATRWRTALTTPEQEELRRMLLAAAARGPVSHRQRAAVLLASLALSGAARDLLAIALSTSSPREATRTVQEAYSRLRIAMVLAVGQLHEPSAVPELIAALDHPETPTLLRRALSWSLLRANTAEARRAVFERGLDGADAYTHALACHALAASRRDPAALRALSRARLAADAAPVPAVRHACQYAVATLLDDAALHELLPRLDGADPLAAAIVAHRVGSAAASPEAIAALLRRWLGPSGLARDAAAIALERLRTASPTDHASSPAAEPAATLETPAVTLEIPAVLEDGRWPLAFDGTLRRVVTEGSPVTADRLARAFPDALAAAAAAAARGTRAERVALHERLCAPEVGRMCRSRAQPTTGQPTGRAPTRGD